MTAPRRWILGGGLALLVLAPVIAAPASALAATRVVPARKLFPYLDAYLKLPPAQRDRFAPTYVLTRDRPAALTLIDGGQRIAIPISAEGQLMRLPTLAQWETAPVEVAGRDGAKYGLTLKMELLIAGAAEMDAGVIAGAVDQLNRGVRSAMGAVGAFAPRADQVLFYGAPSGEAVYPDGRRVALPLVRGVPAFSPSKSPGVQILRFPRAPTALRFS